jgi:hypothetical protein
MRAKGDGDKSTVPRKQERPWPQVGRFANFFLSRRYYVWNIPGRLQDNMNIEHDT